MSHDEPLVLIDKGSHYAVLQNYAASGFIVIADDTEIGPQRKAVRSSPEKEGVELLHAPNVRVGQVAVIHLVSNAIENRTTDPWLKHNHFRFQVRA